MNSAGCHCPRRMILRCYASSSFPCQQPSWSTSTVSAPFPRDSQYLSGWGLESLTHSYVVPPLPNPSQQPDIRLSVEWRTILGSFHDSRTLHRIPFSLHSSPHLLDFSTQTGKFTQTELSWTIYQTPVILFWQKQRPLWLLVHNSGLYSTHFPLPS